MSPTLFIVALVLGVLLQALFVLYLASLLRSRISLHDDDDDDDKHPLAGSLLVASASDDSPVSCTKPPQRHQRQPSVLHGTSPARVPSWLSLTWGSPPMQIDLERAASDDSNSPDLDLSSSMGDHQERAPPRIVVHPPSPSPTTSNPDTDIDSDSDSDNDEEPPELVTPTIDMRYLHPPPLSCYPPRELVDSPSGRGLCFA